MIVWLNGTFGVGKTAISRKLVTNHDELRHFDPEWVGYMLTNNLPDHAVTDFQQYPSWRRLVPLVADEIIQFTGQHLVAAQSVLVEDYWRGLSKGLAELGHEVFHVVLDADADTLHARIDSDQDEPERIRPWRHRQHRPAGLDQHHPARDRRCDAAVGGVGVVGVVGFGWSGGVGLVSGYR